MTTSFFKWVTASAVASFLNDHDWAFPIVQSFHFIGFALSIGTIAIVDFRLLGFGMRRQTAAELAADLHRWTVGGIALMLTTGVLMFSTDAVAYHVNPSFQFKMTCLMLAILYHFTLHRRAVRPDPPPAAAKLAGAVSLVLWTTVLFSGRFIAFI